MSTLTTDKDFVIAWARAYVNNEGIKDLAIHLNVSRVSVDQRGKRMLAKGVLLPKLKGQHPDTFNSELYNKLVERELKK
jgi:hypothetical protein